MPEEDAVIRIDADFGPSEDSLRDFVEEAGRMEVELPVTTKAGTAQPARQERSKQQVEEFMRIISGKQAKLTDTKAATAGADPIAEMNRHVRQVLRGIEQSLDELRNIGRLLERQRIEKPAAGAAQGVFGGVLAGEVVGGIAAGAIISEGVGGGGGGLDPVVAGKELAVQVSRNFSDSFDFASLDEFVTGFESALGDMTGAVIEFTATEIRTTQGLVQALSIATKAFEDVQVAASIPRGGPVPVTGQGELDVELLQSVGLIVGNQVKDAMEPLARAIDQMAESSSVSSSMLQQVRALTIQMNERLASVREAISNVGESILQTLDTGNTAMESIRVGVITLDDSVRTSLLDGINNITTALTGDTDDAGILEALAAVENSSKLIVVHIAEMSTRLHGTLTQEGERLRVAIQDGVSAIMGVVELLDGTIVEQTDRIIDALRGGEGTRTPAVTPDDTPPVPSAEDLSALLGPGASVDIPKPPPPPTETTPSPAPDKPADEPMKRALDDFNEALQDELRGMADLMAKVSDALQAMSDAIIQSSQQAGEDMTQFALDIGFAGKAMREAAEDFDTAKLKDAFDELAHMEIPNEIPKELFEDFEALRGKIADALEVPMPPPTFKRDGLVGEPDFKQEEDAADAVRFQEAARRALEEEGSQISRFAEKLAEDLDTLDTRIKEQIEDLTTINIDIQPEIAPAADIFEAMNEAMELLRTSTLGDKDAFIELTSTVWRIVAALGSFADEVELKQGIPQGMFENLTALGIEIERLAATINNKRDTIEGKLVADMSAELPSTEEAQAFVDKHRQDESDQPGFVSDAEATKILTQMLAELQRVVTNLDAFESTQPEAGILSGAGSPIVEWLDGLKEMKDALHEAAIDIQIVLRSLTEDSKKAHDEFQSIESLEGILKRMRELANETPEDRPEFTSVLEDAQEAANQAADRLAGSLEELSSIVETIAVDLQNAEFGDALVTLEEVNEDFAAEIGAVMKLIKDALFRASDELNEVSASGAQEEAEALPVDLDAIKDAIGQIMAAARTMTEPEGALFAGGLESIFDDLEQAVIGLVAVIEGTADSASELAIEALGAAKSLHDVAQASATLKTLEDLSDAIGSPSEGAVESPDSFDSAIDDAVREIDAASHHSQDQLRNALGQFMPAPDAGGVEPPGEPPPVAGGPGDFDGGEILRVLEEIATEIAGLGRQALNIASDTAMMVRGLGDIESAIDDIELDPTIDVSPEVFVEAQVPDIDVALDMADTNELLSGMGARLDVFADIIKELVDRADTSAVFLMDKVDAIGAIAIDIRDLLSSINEAVSRDMTVQPTPTGDDPTGSVADMHADMLEAVAQIVERLHAIEESVDECCRETIHALTSLARSGEAGDSDDVVAAIGSLQQTVAEGQSELSESLDDFAAESRRGAAAGRAGGAASTGFLAGLFGGGIGSLVRRFVPILGAGVALKFMFDQLTKSATDLSDGFEEQASTFAQVNAPIALGLAEVEMAQFIAEMQAANLVQVEFRRSLMESAKMMRSQTTIDALAADSRRELMEEEFRRLRETLTRPDITAFKEFGTGMLENLGIILESIFNDDMRSIMILRVDAGLKSIWSDLGDRWSTAWSELVEGNLLVAVEQTFLGLLQTIGTLATTIIGGFGVGVFELLGSIISFLSGDEHAEDERFLGGRFQAPKSMEDLRAKAAGQDSGLTDSELLNKYYPLPKAEDFPVHPGKPLDQASMTRAVEDGVTRANSKDQPFSVIPPELEDMFRSELASTFSEQLA